MNCAHKRVRGKEAATEPNAATSLPEPISEQSAKAERITGELVRIQKRATGRGPVKARAYIAGELVTCVLEGGFTIPERKLRDAGEGEHVAHVRSRLQQAAKADMVEAVERILARKVRVFLSATDVDDEVEVETFLLAPQTASA